jgi:hypothetical protein
MSMPAPGSVGEHEFQRLAKAELDPVIAGVRPFRTIAAHATVQDSDYFIRVDATAGAVTVTLPPAARWAGIALVIKKLDAANNVTIDGNGSEEIDGATTDVLTTQYESRTLFSNGTGWDVI